MIRSEYARQEEDFRERALARDLGPRRTNHPARLAVGFAVLLLTALLLAYMPSVGYADDLMPPMLALWAAPLAALLYPLLISLPEYTISPWEELTAKTRLFSALGSLGVALIEVYTLNAVLDRSPAVVKTYPVVSKDNLLGKSGRDVYVVNFEADDSLEPPSSSSAGAQARQRQVSYSIYERVLPGMSRLVLRVHPGALGFAWFEQRKFRFE